MAGLGFWKLFSGEVGVMGEKKIVAFGNAYSGEQNLLCPKCGEDFLHQIKTEIFERVEDGKWGTHIIAESYDRADCPSPPEIFYPHRKLGKIEIDNNLDGNPSPRRQGLKIYFYCELCDEIFILNIYQHKGVTMVEWER